MPVSGKGNTRMRRHFILVYLEFCRASIHQRLQLLNLLETVLTATSRYFNCSWKTALAFPKRSVYRSRDLTQLERDTSFIHLFYDLLQLFSSSTKCLYVLISKKICHLFSLAVSKEIIFLLLMVNYINIILVSIFIWATIKAAGWRMWQHWLLQFQLSYYIAYSNTFL